jgi:diaminohydroxyphosphoribosylaminopyrimidine deaminase/5-amino-6-(5-phosphoribosylamino)uracil reductase
MVGAVVVRDGTVVGEGYHPAFGAPHAEVLALRAAGERARGATMYVTLEPCNHFGKTPPCTEAILEARLARVVIAEAEPTALAGGGARHLADFGIEVNMGVEAAAARELNAPFYFAAGASRPWVTLKLAVSTDWGMNDPTGKTRWITGEAARAEVHRLRANVGAVAVGLGTVKADNPRLTPRGKTPPRVLPSRVVFDRKAETPLDSNLVRTAREADTMIFAHHPPVERLAALYNAGVGVFEAATLSDALKALRTFDVHHVMVEGGAQVARELLKEDLVDRLIIFQAPSILGPDAVRPFEGSAEDFAARLKTHPIVSSAVLGEDVMTVYAIHEA